MLLLWSFQTGNKISICCCYRVFFHSIHFGRNYFLNEMPMKAKLGQILHLSQRDFFKAKHIRKRQISETEGQVGNSAHAFFFLKCLSIENFEIYLFAFPNATLCSDHHATD